MPEKLNPINIIRASAGTGKTFRLASEFSNSLGDNSGNKSPTQIIATTFTNKAANELTHRIRKILLRDGRWEAAQSVFVSFIGTVNSICGRLVSDLAIEAGLSPSVRIIAQERQSEVFNMAVEEVTNHYAAKLWRIIYRMGKEDTWRSDVLKIVDAARENNIEPHVLSSYAEISWLNYKTLLPAPSGDNRSFESSLISELNFVLSHLPIKGDDTEITASEAEIVKEINRTWLATGDLPWKSLIRLSKLEVGKPSRPVVQQLKRIARGHNSLPGFHDDIEKFLRGMFSCAADCLTVYREFKAERGLLDFIDQELLALNVLKNLATREVLQGKFSSLLIDEFQDTSPIQLAVFLELARIVNSSTWVGDEKQSIFGFRGSDPVLMQQVVDQLVPVSGGLQDNLSKSYRSRPQLVEFVNSVFIHAMQPLGIAAQDVEIREVARLENPELNDPLHVWWLSGSNQSASVKSLAHVVSEVLSNPKNWLVEAVTPGADTRPIRGSDIAILCRSNARRLELADELSKFGIVVSTERTGLLKTPECILSIAVLRFLSDRYDTLAMAEIVRYTEERDDEQLWLSEWLEKGTEKILISNPNLICLEELRHKLFGLSPTESLQVATTASCVMETILKWGNKRQRLSNLEALVGIADTYEDFCDAGRQTATISGLVNFISLRNRDALQPANPDEQAVQVLTYHKAKGLEWPMVIMYDLDSPPPATPFGIHLPKANEEFDPTDPLAKRAIRYWPWPYGSSKSNIDLANVAYYSPEMDEIATQSYGENIRLLYVGMTRARDYLVLACQRSSSGTAWLQMAVDESGNCLFNLVAGSFGKINILAHSTDLLAQCSVFSPPAQAPCSNTNSLEQGFCAAIPVIEVVVETPYSCVPSSLRLSSDIPANSVVIEKEIRLGERLNFSETTNIKSLGDALHLFLATDDVEQTKDERLRCAKEITDNYAIAGLNPEQFLQASLRLRNKMEELYPDALWLREWPVTGRRGVQRISGTIDLLLELSEGYVIVDHKSFPGQYEFWKERAVSHFPQLDAYSQLVQNATSKEVIATYIHMPIVGTLLRLKSASNWTEGLASSEPQDNWLVF